MSETISTCQINEKYPWLNCQNPACPVDPDGLCLLHSMDENKDQDGSFTEMVDQMLTAEDYNFRGVFFPGAADFAGQEFTEGVDFSYATFQEADFEGAIFSGNANFRYTKFHGEADFSSVTFSGEADFYDSIFSGVVNFSDASFSGIAKFYDLKFLGEVIFIGTDISENAQVIFRSVNSSDRGIRWLPFLADVGFIKIEMGGRLLFKNLSLAKVTFSDSELLKVEFDNVNWASWWGRAAVYDEIRLHQRKWANIAYWLKYGEFRETRKWRKAMLDEEGKLFSNFSKIERIYRQLKINYEEERDFKRVGDFHYGEMEMHRRGSFWRQWVPISWHNLYRALSGYGERPLRALVWLLLLIPAWAGLIWWLGIGKTGSHYQINYWDTFLFISEKSALQRPAWPESINWLGKLLSNVSVLLIPGQAALFILALRNRLGRRR